MRQREQDMLIGLVMWLAACIAIYGICGVIVVALITGELEIDP
jgi:hypothetical protein